MPRTTPHILCPTDCNGCLHKCPNRECSLFIDPHQMWKSPVGCRAKRTTEKLLDKHEQERREYVKAHSPFTDLSPVIVAARPIVRVN